MFGQVRRWAYISLRCQSLTVRSQSRCIEHRYQSLLNRRWRATAAEPLVDWEPNAQEPQSDSSPPPGEPTHTYRGAPAPSWLLSSKAQLGLSVLGQPAEVLIVPPRLRNPQDEDISNFDEELEFISFGEDETRLSIQEALAAETQYMTPEQATENINSFKREIEQQGDTLSLDDFQKYQGLLAKGFKMSQLLHYIEVNSSGEHASTSQRSSKETAFGRIKDAASHIIIDIWGFMPSNTGDAPWTSTRLKLGKNELNLMLSYRNKYLGDLAHSSGVQIDIYLQDGTIEVVGSVKSIREVTNGIDRLRGEITTGEFELPSAILKLSTSEKEISTDSGQHHGGNMLEGVINFLQRKYRTVLSRTSTTIRYLTFSQDLGDILQREFYALLSQGPTNSMMLDVVRPNGKPVSHVPIFGPDIVQQSFRDVVKCVADRECHLHEMEPIQFQDYTKCVSALHTKLRKNIKHTLDVKSSAAAIRDMGGINHTYAADLGQVFLARQQNSSLSAHSLVDGFSNNFPLIPQILAVLERLDFRNNDSLKDLTIDVDSPVRLRFKPAIAKANHPIFELYAGYQYQLNENGRSIQILQIRLVSSDDHVCMLLPGQLSDLKFSRDGHIDAFRRGYPSAREGEVLLEQFQSYLMKRSTPLHQSDEFAPLLNLNLSCLQTKTHATPDSASAGVTEEERPLKTPPSTPTKLVKYFLDTADYMERTVYALPIRSPSVLEHLTFTPLPCSLLQQTREVVRVCDAPLLCHSSKLRGRNRSTNDGSAVEYKRGNSQDEGFATRSSELQDMWHPTLIHTHSKRFESFVADAYSTVLEFSEFVRSAIHQPRE